MTQKVKITARQIEAAWRKATGGRCYGIGSAKAMLGDAELAAFADEIAKIVTRKLTPNPSMQVRPLGGNKKTDIPQHDVVESPYRESCARIPTQEIPLRKPK